MLSWILYKVVKIFLITSKCFKLPFFFVFLNLNIDFCNVLLKIPHIKDSNINVTMSGKLTMLPQELKSILLQLYS